MRKKIVLWGTDAQDAKILLGIELIDEDNKVKIYTYAENVATEEVYNHMMDKWRLNDNEALSSGYQVIERPLSVTDDLLPEDIRVERTDLISQAKAEWHFIVLSSKLHQMYASELEDFKDKIEQLKEYDDRIWEEMKTFWGKVLDQVRDKNLFSDHASQLKEKTNELFEKLKDLRKVFKDEFRKVSAEKAAAFQEELQEVESKIEKGLGLKPIFDQMKEIQKRFKEETFAKEDQRKLWNRIDAIFKSVKEKRGEERDKGKSPVGRLENRYKGLLGAIDRMQRSVNKDNNDLSWEQKKIDQTDGQLEMQIRQAKIIMIQERLSSKQEKLDDMLKTKADLEKKIQREQDLEAKRQAEQARKVEVAKAKEEVKSKIATEMQEAQAAHANEAAHLETLASEINDSKKKSNPKKEEPVKEEPVKEEPQSTAEKEEESIFEAAAEEIQESIEDTVDTIKAVGSVIADKVKSSIASAKEAASKIDTSEAEEAVEDIKKSVGSIFNQAMESIKDLADKVEDKVEETIDDLKKSKDEDKA